MTQENIFTNIYTNTDSYGFLNILLYNRENKMAILCNGFRFSYTNSFSSIPKEFKELDYSLKLKNQHFSVEGIREHWDIKFIKLGNGDIFQLYSMADDKQHLTIFSKHEHQNITTPTGVSVYEDVERRYNEAEDCDIEVE